MALFSSRFFFSIVTKHATRSATAEYSRDITDIVTLYKALSALGMIASKLLRLVMSQFDSR